ncbi:MAG TPA: response regulator [Candidatus Binatia bacterium]|nr:response regulator [Candidatus Binatia bacterium]
MDRQQLSGFADLLSEAAAFVSKSGVIEVANHPLSARVERTPADCAGHRLGELMPEGAKLQRLVDESVESGRSARSFLSIARGEEIEQLLVIATPCPPCEDRTEPLVLLRLFPEPPSADAARQAKDEFLSAVSHELRSPMNAIVTWAHLLRQGGLDDAVADRALEAIERNARLQARILDDLREISRRPASAQGGASDRAVTDVTPPTGPIPARTLGEALGSAHKVADLSGIRVLVVDDDRDARESITALLLEHHAEASNAGSVREALRNLAAQPPHVVVTDLLMPDLDGFSLLRMIRTIEELNAIRIPTIALTALASEESQRRGLDSGFDVYLMKPVTPDELLSIVAAAAHSEGSHR